MEVPVFLETALSKVDEAIKENQTRIDAGHEVIDQCNKQMTLLKKKDRELRKYKQQLIIKHLNDN